MLFIYYYYSFCYYLNERLSYALSLYRRAKGGLFTPINIFQKTKRIVNIYQKTKRVIKPSARSLLKKKVA